MCAPPAVPAITYPDLPVSELRGDIAKAISEHQVVVIAGETGSGKTTQLPKICLEMGRGVRGTIGHTLRSITRELGIRDSDEQEPTDPVRIHAALVAGLLSHWVRGRARTESSWGHETLGSSWHPARYSPSARRPGSW